MTSPSSSFSLHASLPDSLHISQLSVRLPLGVDSWERLSPQPVNIDIQVHTDVSKAGKSDHLPFSIHYGILVKEVEKHCEEAGKEGGKRYRSLEALADGIAKICLFVCKAPKVTLKVHKPRSLLHAKSAGVEIFRVAEDFLHSEGRPATHGESIRDIHALSLSPNSTSAVHDKVVVKDLLISTILGVNPWERVDKQVVRVNLTAFSGLDRHHGRSPPSSVDVVTSPQNYRTIVRAISEHVEKTDYKTVESLALSIARVAIVQNRVPRIRVRVDKPSAIMFADAAGCEVERDRAFFEDEANWGETQQLSAPPAQAPPAAAPKTSPPAPVSAAANPPVADASHSMTRDASSSSSSTSTATTMTSGEWHVVAIALGSNLGDRAQNIEQAIQCLSTHPDCRLIDTSFLYDTAPMYYTDQPSFLNGACRIATRLDPDRLLNLTQSIERRLGRDKTGIPEKGPRLVDLDVIFYDRIEMTTPRLTIPHASLQEREFVLRPLADILPDYAHPTLRRTVKQLLNILVNMSDYVPQDVHRVMPVPSPPFLEYGTQYWKWGSRTFIMGIINATPDSFSDGGDNASVLSAVATAKKMVAEGVDILDIGGMSTAPNAGEVSEEEETARVVPVIQAIRQAGILIPLSVDTFRGSVAQAALLSGANIVNDVTGGERDPSLLDVVREYSVPVILMHTRGDSKTMNGMNDYTSTGGVLQGVSLELETRVERALRKGVNRWNIILDPGIGFAKDKEGNLELMRGLGNLTGGGGSAGLQSRHALTHTISRHHQARPSTTNNASSTASSRRVSPRASTNNLQGAAAAAAAVLDETAHSPHPSLNAFPLLLGTSRKRFIGAVTGQSDPKQRVFGTAATCVAGVSAGVDILRVHDVKEMKDVATMADAIYRAGRSA